MGRTFKTVPEHPNRQSLIIFPAGDEPAVDRMAYLTNPTITTCNVPFPILTALPKKTLLVGQHGEEGVRRFTHVDPPPSE